MPLVPLIELLWAHGWSALASCQNIAEALASGGAPGGEAAAAYFAGFLWIKMPGEDADALLRLLADHPVFGGRLVGWHKPDGWRVYRQQGPGKLYPSQIHVPIEQLPDLITALELAGPAGRSTSGCTADGR